MVFFHCQYSLTDSSQKVDTLMKKCYFVPVQSFCFRYNFQWFIIKANSLEWNLFIFFNHVKYLSVLKQF
jgi:hypothetical protein